MPARVLCRSNQYSRHKKLVDDYLRYYRQTGDVLAVDAERAAYKSDVDVLRENWRCVVARGVCSRPWGPDRPLMPTDR